MADYTEEDVAAAVQNGQIPPQVGEQMMLELRKRRAAEQEESGGFGLGTAVGAGLGAAALASPLGRPVRALAGKLLGPAGEVAGGQAAKAGEAISGMGGGAVGRAGEAASGMAQNLGAQAGEAIAGTRPGRAVGEAAGNFGRRFEAEQAMAQGDRLAAGPRPSGEGFTAADFRRNLEDTGDMARSAVNAVRGPQGADLAPAPPPSARGAPTTGGGAPTGPDIRPAAQIMEKNWDPTNVNDSLKAMQNSIKGAGSNEARKAITSVRNRLGADNLSPEDLAWLNSMQASKPMNGKYATADQLMQIFSAFKEQ